MRPLNISTAPAFQTVPTILIILSLVLLARHTANAQAFNQPESVVFDAGADRYLVSNQGSGEIIAVDAGGTTSSFNNDATATRGLLILDNVLYAVSGTNTVRGLDLTSGAEVMSLDIAGAIFLNDITTDSTGFLYVTGSSSGQIFKIDIASQTVSTFVSTDLASPNGILYDGPNNRLLVCSFFTNSPIQAVSLADSSVTTVVETNLTDLDGITVDNNGDFYVSSWEDGSVYKFEKTFAAPPEVVSSGHNGPADIYYNRQEEVLAVPNFGDNTVSFIPQPSTSTAVNEDVQPDQFILAQNYPNPFNPSTTISYTVSEAGPVVLTVYDLRGKVVEKMVDQYQRVGTYAVRFEADVRSSATYIYTLSMGGYTMSKTMQLVR